MKNKWLLLLAVGLLASCQSKEEKIAELIRQEMFRTLYDYESYEPIETSKIDSSFTSIYEDPIVWLLAKKVDSSFDEYNKQMKKFSSAKSSYDIWADSYSSHARAKKEEYMDEMKDALDKVKVALDEVQTYSDSVKSIHSTFTPSFQGYSVEHKFRCKTKGGSFDIANYKYVFDEKIERIIFTRDLNNEDNEELYELITSIIIGDNSKSE